MEEIWKSIEGYEGLYEVSNKGRVKSMSKKGSSDERILQPFDNNGYYRYTLRKDGKKKNFMAQQLVAKAFLPNPYNLPYVDHINTDKHNNTIDNLRWVTRKMNCNNPYTRQHNSFATRKRRKRIYVTKTLPIIGVDVS